ncbi:MAG: hypothetical protein F6K24_07590 [Okeania sp. SIO2D1]|nr:hypothetical protein [Okeania sp. SIO2D1]
MKKEEARSKKEEGRRKKEEGRRKKKWMEIVFDKSLRVYKPQPILNTV